MAHPRIDASDVMREPAGAVHETMECVSISVIKQNIIRFECLKIIYYPRINVIKLKQLNTKFEISKRSSSLGMEVKQVSHPNGAPQHPWVVLQQYSA